MLCKNVRLSSCQTIDTHSTIDRSNIKISFFLKRPENDRLSNKEYIILLVEPSVKLSLKYTDNSGS